tara:strand:+ start:32293 stop:32568 length:276 start_codon:yes stop_codon:yes gene_type:complete
VSNEEMVIKEALNVSEADQIKINEVFCKNAEYFSANDVNHTGYIFELMEFYNNSFSGEGFDPADVECDDCQKSIIQFWSFILYDLWERKII